MANSDRKRRTVYRYPVRFTQSQLNVASNLLASTGISSLGTLVHFALAQLAKTSVGSMPAPAQSMTESGATDSDVDLTEDF